MIIREYREEDELGWVRCRLLSFLDSSYFDDIKKSQDTYKNPSICLVAVENNSIIGFINIEYEKFSGDVCHLPGEVGAVIWDLGVLPEYRKKKIAQKLWESANSILLKKRIKRCEVWTQDDLEANAWYQKQGFINIKEKNWLNCFIYGDLPGKESSLVNNENLGEIYGIRCFNFEAKLDRKEELLPICGRIHEVRLYEKKL